VVGLVGVGHEAAVVDVVWDAVFVVILADDVVAGPAGGRVLLAGVGEVGTVVLGVGHAVAVPIVVAGVAHAVAVLVGLVGIGDQGAVVDVVGEAIPVAVLAPGESEDSQDQNPSHGLSYGAWPQVRARDYSGGCHLAEKSSTQQYRRYPTFCQYDLRISV